MSQHDSSDSVTNETLLTESLPGRRFSKKIVVAVLAGAAVVLAPLAIHLGQRSLLWRVAVDSLQTKDEQFLAPMDACAATTDNCFGNKCCKTAGYTCFQTGPATAKCGLTCSAGYPWCQVLQPLYKSKPAWTSGNSMFCYTLYQVQRGRTPELSDNPKELEILKHQKSAGLGIFACDDWKVFSDKKVDFGGVYSYPVLVNQDFTKYMRKDKPDRYLNTPLYLEVWKQIKAEGKYAYYSWTVKAEVATVFLPWQLKRRLGVYPETATGTYIETCNKVLMGYFGNLEVVSKNGMQRFLEQFENYYYFNGRCWRWDTPECQERWQYGPWGEDLFMQFAMDYSDVAKKADYTLTDTGTCPGMRPPTEKDNAMFVPSCTDTGVYKFVAVHPLRNVSAWDACYKAISAR